VTVRAVLRIVVTREAKYAQRDSKQRETASKEAASRERQPAERQPVSESEKRDELKTVCEG